eukprot:9480381-Pyramimonas_sp.AAC.1
MLSESSQKAVRILSESSQNIRILSESSQNTFRILSESCQNSGRILLGVLVECRNNPQPTLLDRATVAL